MASRNKKSEVPGSAVRAAWIGAAAAVVVAILPFVIPAACGRCSPGRLQAPTASVGTAPTLTLTSTSGASVTTGQPYTIAVSAADVDGNLSNVDVNWNDGTAVEHKTVGGSQQHATFTRSFSTVRTINWSANAYDTTLFASNQLSGTFRVTAVDHAPTLTSTSGASVTTVMRAWNSWIKYKRRSRTRGITPSGATMRTPSSSSIPEKPLRLPVVTRTAKSASRSCLASYAC